MPYGLSKAQWVNTLRPRQNGHHFADTFKRIFLNGNIRILIKISLKFVHKGPINNIPALVQIMAWRRPGDKPLSEPKVVNLLMHTCVTRPQRVKSSTSWRCEIWLLFQTCSFHKHFSHTCSKLVMWVISHRFVKLQFMIAEIPQLVCDEFT